MDSPSEFCQNQSWVCEKIPSGSKVPRISLLGSCVGKFTKICFCHWLLCYWLTKHIPPIFASELWNHFDFFHKLGFVWCGTPASCLPYHVMGLTWPRFWVHTHGNSKCILSFGVECNRILSSHRNKLACVEKYKDLNSPINKWGVYFITYRFIVITHNCDKMNVKPAEMLAKWCP